MLHVTLFEGQFTGKQDQSRKPGMHTNISSAVHETSFLAVIVLVQSDVATAP